MLWYIRPSARILTGLVGGALLGALLHLVGSLSGWLSFVVPGALIGAVAGLIAHRYSGSIRLASVTISIPQVSDIEFQITRDGRQTAWTLFVETATRVSTQSMDRRGGLIRETLTSLYGLFQSTRELLKTVEPSSPGNGPSVEELAITMLNLELRPFLTRWHADLRGWELMYGDQGEADWPGNQECREELTAVQERIREYALGFARLAGVPDRSAQIILLGKPD